MLSSVKVNRDLLQKNGTIEGACYFLQHFFNVLSAEMSSLPLVSVRSITHTDINTATLFHAHTAKSRVIVPQNSISSASGHRTEHFSLQASFNYQVLSTINTVVTC